MTAARSAAPSDAVNVTDLQLRRPTAGDADAALDAHRCLSEEGHTFLLDYDGRPWGNYLEHLEGVRAGTAVTGAGRVPATLLFAEVDGELVGRVSLRHHLTDELHANGGHIGYAVTPAHRRRGYATEMLRQALHHAQHLGIDPALLTCKTTNIGSAAVIERCGGQLDTDDGTVRRYWIPTA